MRPPRILFLAPQPFYQLRGMCLAQKNCLEFLAAMGLAVDLLTFPYGEDVSLPRVRILRLPRVPFIRGVPIGPSWRKAALAFPMMLRAAWLCARHRYPVVHACEESAFSAALLKRLFRFKLVYDMDDVLSRRLERSGFFRSRAVLRVVRACEAWMLRSADVVLTNSAETTRFAEALAPRAAVLRYDHLPPAPPAEPLGETLSRRLRAELRAEGLRIILYAGNLEPYQGIGLLLESLPRVLARAPEACCVIVGGEPEQIAAYARKAAALGVAGRVRWLGKRPFQEAFRFMSMADAVVSPLVEEKAVPMKIYSYLASGAPIVATALRSHRELLDASNARLVPPAPEALADALAGTLNCRRPRRRAGLSTVSGPDTFSSAYARLLNAEAASTPATTASRQSLEAAPR
ncbi:MAG: glycosyltransferase [Elusimicrobia bacterium]|nr:glycosyltransferase [Elusimicrobiota bacterium]